MKSYILSCPLCGAQREVMGSIEGGGEVIIEHVPGCSLCGSALWNYAYWVRLWFAHAGDPESYGKEVL